MVLLLTSFLKTVSNKAEGCTENREVDSKSFTTLLVVQDCTRGGKQVKNTNLPE